MELQQPKSQNLLSSLKYYSGSQESLNSDDSILNKDFGETIIGGTLTKKKQNTKLDLI